MRRLVFALRVPLALSMAVLLAAHVGSPDVFWSGRAGAYAIDVVVRPPQVVPGVAEILVHAPGPGISRVTVRPVYWNAGTKGAPNADDASPVNGSPGSYAGRLWLMATGSYAVHVSVEGSAGRGTAVVPVVATPTAQLRLSPTLSVLLAVLGTLLVAGIVTAVYAAIGESQVPPGEPMPASRRRRARIGASIAAAIVGLLVFGGAKWWGAEAQSYSRTIVRPPHTETRLDSTGVPMLALRIADTNFREGRVTPLMPDHGKIAHLFLARIDSQGVLAHLHPVQTDFTDFRSPLPPLPAGRYRMFADIVHESGFQRTLVDSITLTAPIARADGARLDRDDAWFLGPLTAVSSPAPLGDQLTLAWLGDSQPVVGRAGVLRFALRQPSGEPVSVEPYLGMAGHAVVIRDDGKVYVHLHPSGTSAMASELAFALRDRGDTMPNGRLRLGADDMGLTAASPLREIGFPYAFPSPGRYRVWVQLRVRDSVRTAGFEVTVKP